MTSQPHSRSTTTPLSSTHQPTPLTFTSWRHSIYHICRRQLCHYHGARALTLYLLIIIIGLNLLLLVFVNFESLFSPEVLNPEIPVERREASSLLSDGGGDGGPSSLPQQQQFQQPSSLSESSVGEGSFKGEGATATTGFGSGTPSSTPPEWMVQWLERQTWDPTVNETMEGGRQGLVIDVVYTWVNGSDPKLVAIKEYYQDNSPFFKAYRETMAKFARMEGGTGGRVGGGSLRAGSRTAKTSSEGKGDLTANRFRDMDELRYSVRSVAQYADGMFDKIHILTTVVDKENEEGQVPSWLDLEASKQVVQLVNHDMIFENKDNLPSFNSLAIESQIHHIPGMTDIFMYLNDDVFLGRTTSFADVWTPLYGFVFHLEPTLLVPPTILPAPEYTLAVGEWNSLQYSNYLLSKQFGARHRSYLAHVPHVLSTTLLQEIQSMWSEELSETSSHRFRGEGEGHDVQVSFFLAHYVMERLRETQLTSFWFHRLDADQDGQLDWSERERLLKRIDDWNQIENRHRAFYPPLPYFDNFTSYLDGYQDRLQQLGYGATGSSIYRQSGLDGYPFILKNANTTRSHWVAEDVRPYLVYDEVQLKTCHFDVDFCLGSEFKNSAVPSIDLNRSSEIFERMAFSEFHCGDCLLHMLRQSSTEPGLASEILPVNTTSESYARVVQDLKKYNYVVASSSYSFVQLGDPISSRSNLNQILTNPDTESFFCINDNAGDNPQVVQMIQQVFKDFLETRFAFPSPWEKKS